MSSNVYVDLFYNPYKEIPPPEYKNVVINVEDMKHFILRTKDKDYMLDFQELLQDYGVEVE